MSEDILKELIRTGQVTQEAVDRTRMKVDKTLQACAFTLHTLMCNKEHEEDPEMLLQPGSGKCRWYVEEHLDTTWSTPEHVRWLDKTVKVMRELEISESDDMREFLRKLTEVSAAVNDLITQYPKSFKLLEEIAKAKA